MYSTLVSPKSTVSLQVEWNELKSRDFLELYSACKDWLVYSTKLLHVDNVLALCDTFCLTHGQITHPDAPSLTSWSVRPINVFRYKLLSDGSCDKVLYSNPSYNVSGYIVEGAFWSNGFFYQLVKENATPENYLDNLIELNLFIDDHTKFIQGYPDTYTKYSDLITHFCSKPS